jgi:hypothetical protein
MGVTGSNTRRAFSAALNLHGLLADWNEIAAKGWLAPLLSRERQERGDPQKAAFPVRSPMSTGRSELRDR